MISLLSITRLAPVVTPLMIFPLDAESDASDPPVTSGYAKSKCYRRWLKMRVVAPKVGVTGAAWSFLCVLGGLGFLSSLAFPKRKGRRAGPGGPFPPRVFGGSFS